MRLDHVGLNVADLAAAEAWYCRALRLEREIAVRVDAVDLDIVMLKSAEFGHRVELLHRPGSTPGLRAASPAEAALTEGFGHVAFDVPDLGSAHGDLLAAGAREVMAPQPAPEPGVLMSFLADPEGNLIELVQRPRH
jgi:lactoylglutathione lyase